MEEKQAERVSILLMNPQNGEIYVCVNVPEFDLNDPFTLNTEETSSDRKKKQDLLNQMWRNPCLNDTYDHHGSGIGRRSCVNGRPFFLPGV